MTSFPSFLLLGGQAFSQAAGDLYLGRSIALTYTDAPAVFDPYQSRFCGVTNGDDECGGGPPLTAERAARGSGLLTRSPAFFPLEPWLAGPRSLGVFVGSWHEAPSLEDLAEWVEASEPIREYADDLLSQVESAKSASGECAKAVRDELVEIVRDAIFDIPSEAVDGGDARENLAKLGVLEVIARAHEIFGHMIEVWIEDTNGQAKKAKFRISGLIRERAEPFRRQLRRLSSLEDLSDPEDDREDQTSPAEELAAELLIQLLKGA